MAKNDAYIGNQLQLQNHFLTSVQKNISLLSATSILSRSTMAYNATAALAKLTCTDYVDSCQYQDRLGQFSWSENDFNYLDVKLKLLKENDNKEFRLVQNPSMVETVFNQVIQLRNQLVIAAENLAREEQLSPMLIPTMSKDMGEQLKVARKVVDIVDRANRNTCVTLLRRNVDKPESSNAQVRMFATKKADEKFQNFL